MKKHAATWYIAATHYVTAGIIIPFFLGAVMGFLEYAIAGAFGLLNADTDFINQTVAFAVYVIGGAGVLVIIWFSVRYSARYILKTYDVPDIETVIRFSTSCYAIAFVLFEILDLLYPSDAMSDISRWQYVGVDIFFGVASTYIFYVASKKYLKR